MTGVGGPGALARIFDGAVLMDCKADNQLSLGRVELAEQLSTVAEGRPPPDAARACRK